MKYLIKEKIKYYLINYRNFFKIKKLINYNIVNIEFIVIKINLFFKLIK